MTGGTIENWFRNEDDDTSGYTVAYSYQVSGAFFSGEEQLRSMNEMSFKSQMRGRTVMIRYQPERPEISVLLKSDNPGFVEESS